MYLTDVTTNPFMEIEAIAVASHKRHVNWNHQQLECLFNPLDEYIHQRNLTKGPGGRLNKKDGLTRYGDSHVKDKTS